jgi:quercetin dioxygenase-like cupin family protein
MNTNPTPYALGSVEGEALWFPGVLVTIKATAEQTGGEFFLFEEFASRGTATPLHVHPQDHESFYILEGELTIYLDGQPIAASAGSFVHIPKGYFPHAFQVDSETARFHVLTTPAHEHFIRAASEPAQSRTIPQQEPLDMEKVRAAAAEHGVEILGPPPGTQPKS